MKRAALGLLCLLIALPGFAGSKAPRKTPLTMQRCVSLEHSAKGWRMRIMCLEGEGMIVVQDAPGASQYRGSGVFAGSSQEELAATYQSLVPEDELRLDLMQLG
jgi:hypothetical protein